MMTRTLWATMLATTCLWPALALADGPLPTDPTVISGDVTISSPSATQLLLTQGGAYGIVDWGTFSIGQGFGVQFQNGTGATLNRVTGTDLSSIMGTLDATGSVYLVNQNGIVFGQTGQVNTGGNFVASTLDIDNGDFLDGGEATFRGQSNGYVINLGAISSLGGDVAIMGRTVVNEGTISAPDGTVGLAVGREILMRDAAVADGLFSVRIGGSDTSVTDAGAINAAAVELRANGGNVYALAGNTDGTIAATGVARVNGRVFLTAGATGNVKVDKTVTAAAADGTGGTITADGGTVEMAGVLDASGTSGGEVRITSDIATVFSGQVLAFGDGVAGAGGFVEVSGRHLTFGGTVETRGGTVLIDPTNIEIGPDGTATLGGASLIFASTVVNLLLTQNVVVQTNGTGSDAGTIAVTAAVEWSSAFGLSLLAHGDVLLAANVLGSNGANGLNVIAGWDGVAGWGGVAAPDKFDPSAFLAADLATTTLFGTNTGAGYIFDGGAFAASGSVVVRNAQVGVANGATQVFANFVGIGGDGSTGFSQLGFNHTFAPGVVPSGDIVVRARGDVSVVGGAGGDAGAQIGHVGVNLLGSSGGATVNAGGDIRIESGGNLDLAGGGDDNSYAMVGHGSRDFFSFGALGNRTGAITITAAGEISIESSTGTFSRDAWIGHTTVAGVISRADITVSASNFDQNRSVLVGAGGTGTLDIGMLAETSEGGTVTYRSTDATALAGLNLSGSTGPISCECDFVNTAGDVVVQSAGDLLLDTSFFFSNTGGGNIVLAAGRDFRNASGADAFGPMKGVWRIFSTRPDANLGDIATLTNHFVYTEAVFDPANPMALPRGILTGNNGLLYSKVPLVTIGNATMTYGGSLVLPGAVVTVDGAVVDAAAWGFSIDSIFVKDAVVTLSSTGNINAGTFVAALDFTWSPISTITGDYNFLFFGLGDLVVTPAVLTGSIIGTPTKVYDGTDAATLTASDFLLSGFILGEGGTVAQTAGTYGAVNASSSVAVSANLSVGDVVGDSFTNMANYSLPATVSGTGAITPATVTAALIGPISKVYDGTSLATLTAANFALSGFVGADGVDVTLTSGFYRGSNAGTTVGVDVELNATDFVATGATVLSNYFLPNAAFGTGEITQAVLGATITGAPTKVYDGTTLASLTAGNFVLSGFVAGEGGTVAATIGSYASANASGSNVVTVTFAAGDILALDSGTSLANYILPATATGNGVITQAGLTGSIIGTPTRVYDGTDTATLTAANFLLSGFVGSDGATVLQTAGSFASVNAGGTNLVTATLGAGDFAATGATVLSNYLLPTTVTGNGSITQAVVTGAIVGTPTKVYDGTTAATLTVANFLLSGFVAGEGATVAQTAGTYASPNASGSNLVTATLGTGDFAATGATLLANYILPTTVTGNGAITQGLLVAGVVTGAPTKVYDGTTAATLTAANFLLSGFAAGEGAIVTQTAGTYASANASGSNLVTVTLAAGDFTATGATLLANYVLPTTVSGNGVITQAALSGTIIGAPTKVYDGNAIATLGAANFLLSGFVVGEGATITQTAGTYASANASGSNLVTTALAAGDFTATGATLLANYVLPTTVSGNGVITQAALSGTIIGAPSKVYDGNAIATLGAANFLLSGFVVGEGATITQTAGTYASANASGSNLVTVTLAAGDFTATGATLLANYVLPTTVSGNGVITQATLTGGVIGAPIKVYDGTTAATLTAANFLLSGFVAGEGATVTESAGLYASANAGATNLVTVTLDGTDFAATGATLLANYVLPTSVSGNGVIGRALLTAAIIGVPTKPFDANTQATLTPANFSLVGFVAGQGATVTQTTGTYATATAGASNTVTAALAAGDFTALGGTLLANYILPTTASGTGLIDLAPPTQPDVPPTRGLEVFETTQLGLPSGPATGIEVINSETTQRILDEIRAGSSFCKALIRQEFVIDCLSDRLQSVADGLSAVGEYSEVRAALEDAAQQLHALALANASAELAQQVIRAGGRRSSRPLTAVSSEALASANAQAAAIIEGAELVLLRSSSGSAERAVAFSQVAQVVNSTKVLLRSS